MKQLASPPNRPTNHTHNKIVRTAFFCLGLLFFVIGIIGIALPVLPTTPFMLLATACFARSSPKLHAWLYHHQVFGKFIQNWEKSRAIPRRAKYFAWAMMTVSCAMLFYRLPVRLWWLAVLVCVVCLFTMIWMARLPDE